MAIGKLILALLLHLAIARTPPREFSIDLNELEDVLHLNEDQSDQIVQSLRSLQNPVQESQSSLEALLRDGYEEGAGEDKEDEQQATFNGFTGDWNQHWTSDKDPDVDVERIQLNEQAQFENPNEKQTSQETISQPDEVLDCAKDLPSYRSYTGPMCGLDQQDTQQNSQSDNVEQTGQQDTNIQQNEDSGTAQNAKETQDTSKDSQETAIEPDIGDKDKNEEKQQSEDSDWSPDLENSQYLWKLLEQIDQIQNSDENVFNNDDNLPESFPHSTGEIESLEQNNNQNEEFVLTSNTKDNQRLEQFNQQSQSKGHRGYRPPQNRNPREQYEQQVSWITGQNPSGSSANQHPSSRQGDRYRLPPNQNIQLEQYGQQANNNPQVVIPIQKPERLTLPSYLQENIRNQDKQNQQIQKENDNDYYTDVDYYEHSEESPFQNTGQSSNLDSSNWNNQNGQIAGNFNHKGEGGSYQKPVGPLISSNGFDPLPGNQRHSFSCKGRYEGYYPDLQSNCRKFFRCAPPDPRTFSFTCAAGTKFDVTLNVCNHEHKVRCETIYDPELN